VGVTADVVVWMHLPLSTVPNPHQCEAGVVVAEVVTDVVELMHLPSATVPKPHQ